MINIITKKMKEQGSLMLLLEKIDNYHDYRPIYLALAGNIRDSNISISEFIENYNVRTMLQWRNVGMATILKIADMFDKEGLSLKF